MHFSLRGKGLRLKVLHNAMLLQPWQLFSMAKHRIPSIPEALQCLRKRLQKHSSSNLFVPYSHIASLKTEH